MEVLGQHQSFISNGTGAKGALPVGERQGQRFALPQAQVRGQLHKDGHLRPLALNPQGCFGAWK
jgi:hypothetical protein